MTNVVKTVWSGPLTFGRSDRLREHVDVGNLIDRADIAASIIFHQGRSKLRGACEAGYVEVEDSWWELCAFAPVGRED